MNETQSKRTLWVAIVSLVFGCLSVFPGGFIYSLLAVIFGAFALVKISKSNEIFRGKVLAVIGIVMGIIGLIMVLMMVPKVTSSLSEIRMSSNEDMAKETVMLISSVIKTYAAVHDGKYPTDESDLINETPPYIAQSYNNKTIRGYKYSLDLDSGRYKIIATPENCGVTGIKIFETENMGYISEKNCK